MKLFVAAVLGIASLFLLHGVTASFAALCAAEETGLELSEALCRLLMAAFVVRGSPSHSKIGKLGQSI